MPRWRGPPARWALPSLLLLGLIVRLALAPFGRFGYDSGMMRNWSWHLVQDPLPMFYERASAPDHLPGDLWLLYIVSHVFDAITSGVIAQDLDSRAYLVILKSIPAVADLVIAFMLYRIVRCLRGERNGLLAATAWLLNPASIFLTSIWGQWDAVSAALVLIALWLTLRDRWVWAAPLFAWAILIKPPFALLAPLLLIRPIRAALSPPLGQGAAAMRLALARLGARLVAATLLFLFTLLTLTVPFDVGLPPLPTRWTLFERLHLSLNLYQDTTVGALNIWSISGDITGNPDDTAMHVVGLTAQTWGIALLGCVYVLVLATCWRGSHTHGPLLTLVWGPLATCFALYMLPTRVHERYLFPAVVFAVLLAALQPRRWWLAAAMSITYLANLVSVYDQFEHVFTGAIADALHSPTFVRSIAVANLLLLGYVLILPWRVGRARWAVPSMSEAPLRPRWRTPSPVQVTASVACSTGVSDRSSGAASEPRAVSADRT